MRVSKRNCIFFFALSVLRRYFPYKKAVITLSVLFRFHIPVDDSSRSLFVYLIVYFAHQFFDEEVGGFCLLSNSAL